MKKYFVMAAFLILAIIPTHGQNLRALDVYLKAPKVDSQLKVKATVHSVQLSWVNTAIPAVSPAPTCPAGTAAGVTYQTITGNNVYRSLVSGGEGTTPYAPLQPGTSFTDTNATNPGQTYFYQVTETSCGGESAKSLEASATIPLPVAGPPPAVTGLSAVPQ